MCGIAGIFARDRADLDRGVLERMRDSIRHRGPDDEGIDLLPEAGLGLVHTRLSILDLSPAGHQPMWNGARTVAVVFNGEIYNFPEVRKELEAMGRTFCSHSDTEVILQGYEAWGREVVHRLNGMFAFAIWDAARRSLWIVRDRLGVKPLYYYRDEARGLFLFASEIKAILKHPAVPRRVDPQALQSFLGMGYVVAPHTMFAGIRKLPAAHQLELERGGEPSLSRWWDITRLATRDLGPDRQLREEIRRLFRESVERRLLSDVPLGAFLSGGIDSTLVVGMMSRLMKDPVRTFSAAFDVGDRSFKYNVDADAAEGVAKRFGTRHTRLVISMEDGLMDAVMRWVRSMDEPHGNATSVSTLLLSEKVKREGITVALSGDGSDEIFGGYSRYLMDMKIAALQKVPGWVRSMVPRGPILDPLRLGSLRSALTKADLPPMSVDRMMTWWWMIGPETQGRILAPGYRGNPTSAEEAMREVLGRALAAGEVSNQDAMLYADLALWIPEENNMRMDKASMAAALETRAPFLDYKLVEYAMSIPFDRKVGWGNGKKLLKDSFPDLLPPEILKRPKWGWFSPVHHWVSTLLWRDVQTAIRMLPDTGVFTPEVRTYAEKHPPADAWHVWLLFIFALWHREYME